MKETMGIRAFRIAVAFTAILSLAVVAARNIPLLEGPVGKLFRGQASFGQTTEAIASAYKSDDLWGKYDSITLNGLFARLSGRRTYNEVTLLKNGMLTGKMRLRSESKVGLSKKIVKRITSLDSFLKQLDIPFMYVQIPEKEPINIELAPDGACSTKNLLAEKLIAALNDADVKTLDLVPILADTPESTGKYFYRTDHHWTADGAFIAYNNILQFIEEEYGWKLNKETADPDTWERHVKENWWLGSRGKRVGPLFAGVDDLIWLTPNFSTEMTMAIPKKNIWRSGDFSDACIRNYLIETKDLYQLNNHALYLGNNYGYVFLHNKSAKNPKKVLLIKDSFGKSTAAFLATTFVQVDLLDPRSYDNSSIAQYIDWTKPDIVIMMASTLVNTSSKFIVDFGTEQQQAWREQHHKLEEVLHNNRVSIPAKESNKNFLRLDVQMDPGNVYHVDMEDVVVTSGDTEAFSMVLYDKTRKRVISSTVFDIEYCRLFGGFHWVFQVPSNSKKNAKYELRVSPGIYQKSENIGLELSELTISKE